MRCRAIPGGFVCGPSPRRRKCVCGGWADLECDWPLKLSEAADRKWTPAIGDARVHLKQWRIYYVHQVLSQGRVVNGAELVQGELLLPVSTGPEVVVAREPPRPFETPAGGFITCSFDHWYEKLAKTCDRPVCRRCVSRFKDRLDFCAAHGRELARNGLPRDR